MESTVACPKCNNIVHKNDVFCAACGHLLKAEPHTLPFGKIISVYLVSFFVPPSGIYFAVKYSKSQDEKTRRVGTISLFLTIISLCISLITIILGIKIAYELLDLTNTYLPLEGV